MWSGLGEHDEVHLIILSSDRQNYIGYTLKKVHATVQSISEVCSVVRAPSSVVFLPAQVPALAVPPCSVMAVSCVKWVRSLCACVRGLTEISNECRNFTQSIIMLNGEEHPPKLLTVSSLDISVPFRSYYLSSIFMTHLISGGISYS